MTAASSNIYIKQAAGNMSYEYSEYKEFFCKNCCQLIDIRD